MSLIKLVLVWFLLLGLLRSGWLWSVVVGHGRSLLGPWSVMVGLSSVLVRLAGRQVGQPRRGVDLHILPS